MNEIFSRLGLILTAIYFAPLLLPNAVKIFEAPSALLLSFVAAPKKNPGTGGNVGLLKSRATLNLGCFALTGCSCYQHSHD